MPPRCPPPADRTATNSLPRNRVRARIDQHGRPVELVADPDPVLPDSDSARPVADGDRRRDRIARGIDARNGSVEVVRDPDRSRSDGDPDGIVADADRVADRSSRGVDAEDDVSLLVCYPQAAAAGGKRARRRSHGCAGDQPARVRIELPDRLVVLVGDPNGAA